jgi:probable DNA repair protein
LITLNDDTTLVVPSRQRAHAVRLARAARAAGRGEAVWRSPDVLPVEGWVGREIERRARTEAGLPQPLSPTEEWWLWREATAAARPDADDVTVAALADDLRAASALALAWKIDAARWGHAPGEEVALWRAVEARVHDACHELGADSAMRIATRCGALGGAASVDFAGFGVAPPALRNLHAARTAQGQPGTWRDPDAGNAAEPTVVVAADETEELDRIARGCLDRLSVQPDARLLVVIAGPSPRRERLASLIASSLAPGAWREGHDASNPIVAVEGGGPLIARPLVQHAITSLTWLLAPIEFDAFSTWLCAPFNALGAMDAAQLDLALRRHALAHYDARTALPRLPDHFRGRTIAALESLGSGSSAPRQWSERFRAALDALGWPGAAPLDSEGQQTRVRFVEVLDALGEISIGADRVDGATALRALRELAGRERFQPATGDPSVTITASHADPIVAYDAVWVAGLDAEVWPQSARCDPYLPVIAQREAGIPQASVAGQIGAARTALGAWRSATRDLTVSTAAMRDGVPVAPSPLLAPWMSAALGSRPSIWLPARARQDVALESIPDGTATPWNLSMPLPGGARSLELQNLCPFRAHAELRWGAAPLEAYEPGVPPRERGIWLHGALEHFWRTLAGSQGLAARDSDAIAELAEACVERTCPRGARPPSIEREWRRLSTLLQVLADLDRTREPFEVVAMEREQSLALGAANVDVRLDRVDRIPSRTPFDLAILDYKSGTVPDKVDWQGERPEPVQLFTYLAAVGASTGALATLHLTHGAADYAGLASDDGTLPAVDAIEASPPDTSRDAWRAATAKWTQHVERLAEAFVRGDARVDPRERACRHCALGGLCRIEERRER